jgi:PhnB protein
MERSIPFCYHGAERLVPEARMLSIFREEVPMTKGPNEMNIPSIPEGYHTVTPWIISRDTAQLIDFVQAAFGAEELARVFNEDGTIGHAEARVGDSIVMMFDAKSDWPDTPAFLRLYVEDAQATFHQALAAGAITVTELTHLFWGDLVGRIRDPLGNIWWIQQRVEEVTPEELARRLGDATFIDAMHYVQSAEFFPNMRQM